MKKKLRQYVPKIGRKHQQETAASEGPAPRITNETIAEHREEVLSTARKYIFPLQHSKHKIVLVTTSLVIAAVIAFFSYSLLALYKLQSDSTFLYHSTQVIPFPVAKAGSSFVAYENYLFELRHYKHYYETQQKLDFRSDSGKQQLADFKKRALDKVVNDAYVKQLAKQHHVSVSDREVNDTIQVVRNQNRLGDSDKVFEDVLKDFWGWSVDDFKRSLREQLLEQKVVSVMDADTHHRAEAALAELKSGADFAAVAAKYSADDATKNSGGDFGFPVDRTNRDLTAQTTEALFKLPPGQISDIVNTGYELEILKNIENQADKIKGAHIVFKFKDITAYVNDLKDKQKTRLFIRL